MKILALSDHVVRGIYSPNVRDQYGNVDLVIGCGDLPYYYLEYIATVLTSRVIYVFGNHDKTQYMSDGRIIDRAEGCVDIDGRAFDHDGLLLAGLGGSMRYQPGAINQYTEFEMQQRVAGLIPQLLANKVRTGRYLDVLITHSPPYGIHDGDDRPHVGFKSFLTLMRYFKPRYLLHGHKHIYRQDIPYTSRYEDTTVINVFPARLIKWDANE